MVCSLEGSITLNILCVAVVAYNKHAKEKTNLANNCKTNVTIKVGYCKTIKEKSDMHCVLVNDQ